MLDIIVGFFDQLFGGLLISWDGVVVAKAQGGAGLGLLALFLQLADINRERGRQEGFGEDLQEGMFGEEGVLAPGNLPPTVLESGRFQFGDTVIGGPSGAPRFPGLSEAAQPLGGFLSDTFGVPPPEPGAGLPFFDMGEVFGGPAETLDWFRANRPDVGTVSDFDMTGFLGSLGQTRESIAGMIEGGQVSQEDILSGVDLPEADLSEVLAGRMAGITQVSRGREELQRESLASVAGGFGGLENLRRQSETLGFEEATRRGTEGAVATGDIRMEEALRESQRANIQFGAASLSEQINAALLGEQMKQEGALGGIEARGLLEGGIQQTNVERWNEAAKADQFSIETGLVSEANNQQLQQFGSFLQIHGMEFEQSNEILGLLAQGRLNMAALLMNQEMPGLDWMSTWENLTGGGPPKTVRVRQ